MPADFLDTSALAKHYHAEAGSAEVDRLWNDPAHGLFVSRLFALEIVSVFAGKVRAGAISAADFQALRRRFSADLTKTKRLFGTRLLVAHYQEAERLLREHGPLRRLRTLDASQLAVALDLYRKKVVQRVVSAHKDLLAVAALEGLRVLNPENPSL
jgi:predicted nucleic acid-binding protein